ncbi:YlxR family protein [Microbacterium esteraromaticum]|uniref:YlxR family protein n=1 Tax=Microbacterium esteraromaticum TaxID=57043 RepID=A0A7D7WGZ2_9MICO|nr:YlxR family protein [Microbacterium esteraromaticum]QMU97911.1 YlxR family protein [Microbacterium esteraromaticum]
MDPVRTCVGCRGRASRTALIRVVAQNDRLVIDERAALPGRGAWLHPSPECLDTALRRKAFARALRVPPSIGFPEAEDAQTIQRYFHRNKG